MLFNLCFAQKCRMKPLLKRQFSIEVKVSNLSRGPHRLTSNSQKGPRHVLNAACCETACAHQFTSKDSALGASSHCTVSNMLNICNTSLILFFFKNKVIHLGDENKREILVSLDGLTYIC